MVMDLVFTMHGLSIGLSPSNQVLLGTTHLYFYTIRTCLVCTLSKRKKKFWASNDNAYRAIEIWKCQEKKKKIET